MPIATELALAPALIGQMRVAGLLHYVGKTGVPDAILTKTAALTDADYGQMKRVTWLVATTPQVDVLRASVRPP